REEYDRLVEAGILTEDEPVELLAGEIVRTCPKWPIHSATVQAVAERLRAMCSWRRHPPVIVRIHEPFAATNDSEPEPDIAIVPGQPRDYARVHPSRAEL